MKFHRIITRQNALAALLLAGAACTFAGPDVAGWLRGRLGYVLAPLGDGVMYMAARAKRNASDMGLRAISPDEAAAFTKRFEEQWQARNELTMKYFDADKDGKLSETEQAAARKAIEFAEERVRLMRDTFAGPDREGPRRPGRAR